MKPEHQEYAVLTRVFDLTDPESVAAVVCVDFEHRCAVLVGRIEAFELYNPFKFDAPWLTRLFAEGFAAVGIDDLIPWLRARLSGSFSLGAENDLMGRDPFMAFEREAKRSADFSFWLEPKEKP